MFWAVLLFLLVLWVLKFGFDVESLLIPVAMALSWLVFIVSLLFSKGVAEESSDRPHLE